MFPRKTTEARAFGAQTFGVRLKGAFVLATECDYVRVCAGEDECVPNRVGNLG